MQASIQDVCTSILSFGEPGQGKVKGKATTTIVLKKPSTGNRRFDSDDVAGEERTGESRDYSKALCKYGPSNITTILYSSKVDCYFART